MKVLIGATVAFLVGAGCRYFDIPVPSPPVLPGALLVVVGRYTLRNVPARAHRTRGN